MLVAATWRHTYIGKFVSVAHPDTPLTTLFLRDGTAYFITILALLILNITLLATAGGYLSTITVALETILLSRFYLKPHAASISGIKMPSSPSQVWTRSPFYAGCRKPRPLTCL
ncbi:hypothetical protein DAEQUDRAFT_729588 [Daedalea quercina L-15889]|uniref:Uncharacterized protein n=1 Tax=Daedalea quercina L-15889 TaxID=1314783 RepID=A0A165NHY5_9APHY|nr:hypothetical protein DAEQUDRAFT_729588 [Daedalea quercina L-15889]